MLLCAALYLPPAARTPFFTKGEPREALVVRHIVEEGDWLLPRRPSARGWTIASKPPFFHWLGALTSTAAGGTSELSVRLPSLVLGTAAVVGVGAVGAGLLAPRAGIAAAVVLATSFEWLRAASSARVDATLTALMTGALLLFYRGVVHGGLGRREALAASLLLVAATLTKGPVGAVLPLLVLVAALAALKRLGTLPAFRPLLGVLVIVVFVATWYGTAWQLGGEVFLQKHILKENVFRFLGTSRMQSGHEHPFYYYVPTLAAGLLPWTVLVVAALAVALRSPAVRREPRIAFLLVWFAVVLAFYSLASAKRSVYLLPLYPPGALLVGWWWEGLVRAGQVPGWLRGRAALTVIAAAAALVLALLAVAVAEAVGLAPLTALAPVLKPRDRANLPVVRELFDLHLAAVVGGLGLLLVTLAVLAWALRRTRWRTLEAAATVFAAVLWLLIFAVFQPALAERRTFAPFLRQVADHAGEDHLYFYPGTFDFGAAFYTPRGTRHWRLDRPPGPGPHYVLIWDRSLAELPASERARFEVVTSSAATDPKGKRHLVLARIP